MTKCALLGYGYWGPNLARNLYENRKCDLVYICDTDEERLRRAKDRFPLVDITAFSSTVIEDESVDAVLVATPIASHFELAKMALLSGKDVFVEKPITNSTFDAEELVRLAHENERILMVGHTFEYSPPVLKVKEFLEAGELGDILFISSTRVNLGIHQRDVSVIWDLAPHDISILINWLGEEPVSMHVLGRGCFIKDVPDVAFISIRFPSSVIANVEVSWLSPTKLRRTTVVGSKKMLVYDDTEHMEKIRLFDKGVVFKEPEDFGEFQLSYRTGNVLSPFVENYEPLQLEISHFLDCVRSRQTPRTDGVCGLRVVRALEMAEKSLSGSQLRVEQSSSAQGQ
jgi:predicted dehydrogenase